MDSYENRPQTSRDTYLIVVLFVLVGIPVFVFFNVITNGLLISMLAVAGGLGALGAIHYFLWGRNLSNEVAGERHEQESLEESQLEEWPDEAATGPRHIGPL